MEEKFGITERASVSRISGKVQCQNIVHVHALCDVFNEQSVHVHVYV